MVLLQLLQLLQIYYLLVLDLQNLNQTVLKTLVLFLNQDLLVYYQHLMFVVTLVFE